MSRREGYAGRYAEKRTWRHILEKLGFTFLETALGKPTGLLHPS